MQNKARLSSNRTLHRFAILWVRSSCRLTFASDNAAMIGWASMHRFLAGDYDDYSVELRSKWSIETLPDGSTHLLDQL